MTPVSDRVVHHPTVFLRRKRKSKEWIGENYFSRLTRLPANRYVMFGLTALTLISFIFFTHEVIKTVIFVAMLALASYSTVYKRKMGMPLGGPELVTFGTVLTGVAYGPWAGLIFGIISSTASEVISAGLGPTTWIYVLTVGGVGLAAGYLHPHLPLLLLGMLATVMLLAINQLIFFVVGDPEVKAFTMFYIVANILFNLLMFGTLSGRVITFMTLSA